jgi:hypothetical protein
MSFLTALLSAFARAIASLLQSLVSGLNGISITDFSPRSGWPGDDHHDSRTRILRESRREHEVHDRQRTRTDYRRVH